MSLLVVAGVALLAIAGMAWLVRQSAFDHDRLATNAESERLAFLGHMEREACAARDERQRMCDRIEAPGATAAQAWRTPEATASVSQADEEWLRSKESEVPWDEDLQLADTELGA